MIIKTQRLVVAALLMAMVPLNAWGACREKLAEVDARLASSAVGESTLTAVVQFRDLAASLCERGHEETAMQTLAGIDLMLTQEEAALRPREEPAIKAAPQPAPAVQNQQFANRWDKLAQMDYCQWLTPEELARELDFHAPLECRKTHNGFRYALPRQGDDWPVAFMLIVETHPSQQSVRKAEAGVSEGFSKRQFTPADVGTPEMNVYVSNKGHYLYAFPAGGLTLWRLEYLKDSERRDRYYSPSPDRSADTDLGLRFMEILVAKYADRL